MFDINSAKDRLFILVSDYDKLVWDPLNVSLAEKCCVDAWHLADWHYDEVVKPKNSQALEQYRSELFKECPEMKVLHDIANTIKHKELTRAKAKIQLGRKHEGPFSPDFSKDFDVSRLEVVYDDNKTIDIDDLVKIAIEYWKARVLK